MMHYEYFLITSLYQKEAGIKKPPDGGFGITHLLLVYPSTSLRVHFSLIERSRNQAGLCQQLIHG